MTSTHTKRMKPVLLLSIILLLLHLQNIQARFGGLARKMGKFLQLLFKFLRHSSKSKHRNIKTRGRHTIHGLTKSKQPSFGSRVKSSLKNKVGNIRSIAKMIKTSKHFLTVWHMVKFAGKSANEILNVRISNYFYGT